MERRHKQIRYFDARKEEKQLYKTEFLILGVNEENFVFYSLIFMQELLILSSAIQC